MDLKKLIELSKHCGWWIPFKDICILQHRHCELHRNANHQLHNECGMAVKYPDGWGLYALNGVRVPEWLVLTKSEDLNPRDLLKIDNVEIRKEFVRKVGMERICHVLKSTCIDRQGDYELLLLEIRDEQKRPYLKMLNPSLGTWHVEGVHPDCKTVQDAINYRRYGELNDDNKDWKPVILT